MSAEWMPKPDGVCSLCHKHTLIGYAVKDKDGEWRPACWDCLKPKREKNDEQDSKTEPAAV